MIRAAVAVAAAFFQFHLPDSELCLPLLFFSSVIFVLFHFILSVDESLFIFIDVNDPCCR